MESSFSLTQITHNLQVAINSLGPHTARWAKAWDCQKPCSAHFPGDAGGTTLATYDTFVH